VLQKAVECCRILQLGAASNLELIRGRRLQRGGAAGGRQGDDGGGRDAQRKPVRLWARVYVGVCACLRACLRARSRVRACLCLFRRGSFSSCVFLAVFAVLVVLAVMAVLASVLSLARVCRRGCFSCLCASVCVCVRACVCVCVCVCVGARGYVVVRMSESPMVLIRLAPQVHRRAGGALLPRQCRRPGESGPAGARLPAGIVSMQPFCSARPDNASRESGRLGGMAKRIVSAQVDLIARAADEGWPYFAVFEDDLVPAVPPCHAGRSIARCVLAERVEEAAGVGWC
jgi:hypothetical protein